MISEGFLINMILNFCQSERAKIFTLFQLYVYKSKDLLYNTYATNLLHITRYFNVSNIFQVCVVWLLMIVTMMAVDTLNLNLLLSGNFGLLSVSPQFLS